MSGFASLYPTYQLVQDITSFYDSHNDIGGDPDQSNRNIAKHWVEASERQGMPVKSEGFKLFSLEHPSTYPQNIAYKAAQVGLRQSEMLYVRTRSHG